RRAWWLLVVIISGYCSHNCPPSPSAGRSSAPVALTAGRGDDGGHPLRLAVQVGGGAQPVAVRVVGEQELAALEGIHHLAGHRLAHRRTALAAADAAVALDPGRVHIVGAVDDDGAVPGPVVD